ncbi:MAG: acetyl-CoA carboxylase biotin carboxyl carrier protein [Candidatus Omnitrophota bacterium]|jgi:acetyl-CoA carboxylase biotin carboxyl carrier protein
MNVKEIKDMVDLMNENGLVELEIEKEGTRIRLKKSGAFSEGYPGPIVIEKVKTSDAPQVKESLLPAGKATAGNIIEIKSPMVGTFYRAPSPEAPPYVEANQSLDVGQVICIIEAMKLMNEIKSEIKGRVVEILVGNAEPVEFGQPLFLIEPL